MAEDTVHSDEDGFKGGDLRNPAPDNILPCPFCGTQPKTFWYDGTWQVQCQGSFQECAGNDVVAPVAMWNRRA